MLADLHLSEDLSTVHFNTIITDLDSAYGKKVSKLASRVRFQSIVQHESQSVDEYLADIRHSSIDCCFGDQLDNRLKNQFVVGLRSDQIMKKLREEEEKALSDIVKKARDLELVNRESRSSKSAPTSEFSAQQVRSGTNQTRFIPRGFQPESSQSTRFQTQQSLTNYTTSMPCYRCAASGHKFYECSYFINRLQCNNCNRTGHKALVCCQPRQRGRGRTAFQPQGSSHTQRGTPNSF